MYAGDGFAPGKRTVNLPGDLPSTNNKNEKIRQKLPRPYHVCSDSEHTHARAREHLENGPYFMALTTGRFALTPVWKSWPETRVACVRHSGLDLFDFCRLVIRAKDLNSKDVQFFFFFFLIPTRPVRTRDT